MRYVDGFVLPVPKKKVGAYRRPRREGEARRIQALKEHSRASAQAARRAWSVRAISSFAYRQVPLQQLNFFTFAAARDLTG